jgi:hypothetical protein
VFYPRAAKNNPTNFEPNWFYYWKALQVCGIPSTAVYTDSTVYNAKYSPAAGIISFGRNDVMERLPYTFHATINGNPVQLVAGGSGTGIVYMGETVAHELRHQSLEALKGGRTDSENDGVADADEPTLDGIVTVVGNRDTYGTAAVLGHAPYANYGDEEIRARRAEENHGVTLKPKLDWANPGCNSKNFEGVAPPAP